MLRAMTSREIERAFGIPPRTLRGWVAKKALPRVKFGGAMTMYPREVVARAAAIRKLQGRGESLWSAVSRIDGLSVEELEALAVPAAATTGPAGAEAGDGGAQSAGEVWTRVELVPGLELHVKAPASALVLRLAEEIRAKYRATS
jgi:DNA-binding transcriptional MerR regulator